MSVNVIETYLEAVGGLSKRSQTDMVVIHHTGCNDIDASAKEIDGWHKGQGWSMIGYHYVIRKNGNIERGRPEWAIGSHAYGENYHTIGIHLSGDFMQAYPTKAQLDSCAELIADICDYYDIPINTNTIVGHCDLMATDCPGTYLYAQLPALIMAAEQILSGQTLTSVTIQSGQIIEQTTVDMIKAIFKESQCPNESMFQSIKDFSHFNGHNLIQLAPGDCCKVSFNPNN